MKTPFAASDTRSRRRLIALVSALVVIVGVALFFWAVNHAQFDDLDTPGLAPLVEDRALPPGADSPAAAESPPPAE